MGWAAWRGGLYGGTGFLAEQVFAAGCDGGVNASESHTIGNALTSKTSPIVSIWQRPIDKPTTLDGTM